MIPRRRTKYPVRQAILISICNEVCTLLPAWKQRQPKGKRNQDIFWKDAQNRHGKLVDFASFTTVTKGRLVYDFLVGNRCLTVGDEVRDLASRIAQHGVSDHNRKKKAISTIYKKVPE